MLYKIYAIPYWSAGQAILAEGAMERLTRHWKTPLHKRREKRAGRQPRVDGERETGVVIST